MREVIAIAGVEFNLHTSSIDSTTWTLLYSNGQREPRFPVPAIRYETVFPWEDAGYCDMIFVNDVGVDEDPVIVACWDFHEDEKPEWRGKYQACYTDHTAQWYKDHGAWR